MPQSICGNALLTQIAMKTPIPENDLMFLNLYVFQASMHASAAPTSPPIRIFKSNFLSALFASP